jgi:hypothetical protein
MSVLDLRERLMPRLAQPEGPATAVVDTTAVTSPSSVPPAMVVMTDERITLTAPAEQLAAETAGDMLSQLYVKLRGRFVEAERANGNGAFWSAGDLQFGLPTVTHGPLNWLHEERRIVGVLSDARFVGREAAAVQGVGPHITADATMWRWLYPQETRLVERAADERQLWYSMECVSPEVACVGEHGCGAQVPYLDALRREGAACEHMKDRSAVRRFVDPIFQGGAIIVPPVKPGWASADLQVVREAAQVLERDDVPRLSADMSDEQATQMVQQVLDWAHRTGS